MDKSLFRFQSQIRVRNYEIDWQGIVHNAVYLLYFETGRIDYLRLLGVRIDHNAIQQESRVVLVRNEINYKSSAKFDDLLTIYTRVSFIRNTSFAFEGIIENASTGKILSDNLAVHVWLDGVTGVPIVVKDEFRKTIQQYEGRNVKMMNNLNPL
jgi:acyl-CoA thioester hydrolase